jgi:tellurite resistance protein TerC
MHSATPLSHWIGFHVFIIALLAMELLYDRRTNPKHTDSQTHRTAIAATVLWISVALAFALFILYTMGSVSAVQYLAGYAIEESLSIDNLFVFLLLFHFFQIAPARQPPVLFWGVAGAIVMRGAFIAAGLSLLARFEWISYIFAVILLGAAIRLLMPQAEKEEEATPAWIKWLARIQPVSLRQDHFFVIENGRRMGTILFVALIAIELTDLVFALDSIPAVLSITRHPFLAYTSNIMAVMGLRSLYFLLAHLLTKLRYLHYGLAAVLIFAAFKMLSASFLEIGPLLSLAVILATLSVTVLISLLKAEKPSTKPL